MRIGILGPAGTFSETAAMLWMRESVKDETCEIKYYDTIFDVSDGLLRQDVDYAIVPLENSLEGSVGETLDILSRENVDVQIVGEILVPIQICLMAKQNLSFKEKALPGKHAFSSHEEASQALARAGIRKIVSHPHALAQCKRFLREQCRGMELKTVDSTAGAAKLAAQSEEIAALASEAAADKYRLNIIAEDVQDRDSVTRFVVLSSSGIKTVPTGKDKTSILLYLKENSPGALYEILGEFALRGINMTKIESRPSKKAMGDYMFHIDCEGHIDEDKMKEALRGIKRKVAILKTLGSYPMAIFICPGL